MKNRKTVEVTGKDDADMRRIISKRFPGYVIDRAAINRKIWRVVLTRRK